MELVKRSTILAGGLTLSIFAAAAPPFTGARAEPTELNLSADILMAVKSLHGLSEEQVIARLAAEAEAANLNRLIEELALESYAGSWFDGDTWNLHVAISNPDDSTLIKRLGATPMMVEYNLSELEDTRALSLTALRNAVSAPGFVRESFVDYQSNRVVVSVAPGNRDTALSVLDSIGIDQDIVEIREMEAETGFSTGNVRGADGFRNRTWQGDTTITCVEDCPCSIGASIVGGFATAGHCGNEDDLIDTPPPQESLGTVIASDGPFFRTDNDGAWVDTVPGWTPKPQVNGYNDGILYVSSEFAGLLSFPVGTTACRYGQSSGGPHCGQIEARNVTWEREGTLVQLDGMIKTSEICQNDGDSGGPLVSGTVQMQGTLSGGTRNSCPNSADDIGYYQPIQTTLTTLATPDLIMLTPHGANAPTIADLSCDGTGFNNFVCSTSYHAQGEPTVSWDLNGSFFGTGTSISGTCVGDQWNSVDVDATNTYGTGSDSTSFYCYSGSPP